MVTAWTYGHFLVSIEMAGALFALVVSVGLLLQSPPKPLFASFLLLLALPQISIAMEFAGVFEAFPILFYAIVPFHVFTGPVGYSALQQISGEKRISVGLMLVAFIIAASASTASFFSGDRISIDLLLVTIRKRSINRLCGGIMNLLKFPPSGGINEGEDRLAEAYQGLASVRTQQGRVLPAKSGE
ncbi:MAG: hypothetical protein F9K24_18370 [Leptonema illini]|uniref:Uncharacterized protein n=1 Tax=Leptonema illini TaxID=183 RepID=A0A833GYQ4_9LEPT|nr:MAG: hypothetical protein F9K24_18370 [Leptonema illini]